MIQFALVACLLAIVSETAFSFVALSTGLNRRSFVVKPTLFLSDYIHSLETAPTAEVASEETEEEEKPQKSFKRERYTAFVGNLSFDVTDSQLRDLFGQHGTVELVSVPRDRKTGQPRGFGFVDMSTPEELEKVIDALDGEMFEARVMRVNKTLPKGEAQKQVKKKDKDIGKIYVGNIPFETTKEQLIDFFSEYGDVFEVYVPINPNTGAGRGFAFVSMKEDVINDAIEATNGQEFLDRTLVVNIPLPPGKKAPTRPANRMKLYIGNLSFYTVADTLKEVFEEFGDVIDCYLPEDTETGSSRGFGFVTMEKEAALTAIDELDGCELDGRIIRVNEAHPKGRERRAVYEDEDEGGWDQ